MKSKLIAAGAAFATVFAMSAFGASGIFGAFVQIDNGDGGTWYASATDPDAQIRTDFDGVALVEDGGGGAFTSGDTLTISSAEVMTFKNGASDVTSATIFYRVYDTGGTPGAYTSVSISFGSNAPFNSAGDGENYTNSGDQSWNGLTTQNLLAGLTVTDNYTIDVYWEATTNIDGTHSVGSAGSPESATFNFTGAGGGGAVPEPSTMALLGVSSVILGALRRRKVAS